jgi:hypothetical protein
VETGMDPRLENVSSNFVAPFQLFTLREKLKKCSIDDSKMMFWLKIEI